MPDAPAQAPVRAATKPRSAGLWIGACYNPHLGKEILASAELFDHLVIVDAPRQNDPHFPALRERVALPVHDEHGQLADPWGERPTSALRLLAEVCHAPWVAERVQCMRTVDGKYGLDCVFPPLYTEEMRDRFASHAVALGSAIGRPLLLENVPSAFTLPKSTLSEGHFMAGLCEATRAALMLNLPHIWVSAELKEEDPYGVLHEYPLERVSVIATGGVMDDAELGGPWMAPVPPSDEMMEFTQYAVDCCRSVRAVTLDARGPSLEARLLVGAVTQLRERLSR